MSDKMMVWSGSKTSIYRVSQVSPIEVAPAIYNLRFDRQAGKLFLSYAYDKFDLPAKIYDMDVDFVKRTIVSYKNSSKSMGVLLNGLKGAGKTVTTKIIANELNLPVIIISEPNELIPDFIQQIDFECIVLADEYEKVFRHDDRGLLLSCMDGTQNSKGKVLYLLTTNNLYINENLLNRPSRIRYVKTYNNLKSGQVKEIVNDLLINKEHESDAIECLSRLDIITVDLIIELIKEANLHEEPISKFITIFNCNRGGADSVTSHNIINKETGEVIYSDISLREYLSPQTVRNQWISDEEHNYILKVIEPTGENTSRVLINNPAYSAYEELEEEEQEKTTEPPATLTLEIIYERIPRKHWAFMD